MKKILLTFSIMSSFLLCSCGVTPVAYTTFIKSSESQYVYYSSDAYGLSQPHISVYKSYEESQEEYAIADIEITFTRCLGVDDVDEVRYTLVDLSQRALEMTVYLTKTSEIYEDSKQIYLNNAPLTPYLVSDLDTLKALHFENINFVRTNNKGKLDYTKINTLEYK